MGNNTVIYCGKENAADNVVGLIVNKRIFIILMDHEAFSETGLEGIRR